jgi:hypothetical protein
MNEDYIIRTCRIEKSLMSTKGISEIVLYFNEFKDYKVAVISDDNGLFEDFDFDSKIEKDIVIEFFEEECMNRFTCFNEFTLDEIQEQGERIEFNNSL